MVLTRFSRIQCHISLQQWQLRISTQNRNVTVRKSIPDQLEVFIWHLIMQNQHIKLETNLLQKRANTLICYTVPTSSLFFSRLRLSHEFSSGTPSVVVDPLQGYIANRNFLRKPRSNLSYICCVFLSIVVDSPVGQTRISNLWLNSDQDYPWGKPCAYPSEFKIR